MNVYILHILYILHSPVVLTVRTVSLKEASSRCCPASRSSRRSFCRTKASTVRRSASSPAATRPGLIPRCGERIRPVETLR